MDALTELQSNVHQLTREHTRRHVGTFRHEGRTYSEEAHGIVPSLIQQLRDSMGSSSSDGSGGGKPSSRLPVNAAALQLYDHIGKTAATRYSQASGLPRRAQVEHNITGWMARSLESEGRVEGILLATREWVTEITTLLAPQRTFEIVGTCPACGFAKHWVEVDGELCLSSTLSASGMTVTCQYEKCGQSWMGEQLHWLHDALNMPGASVG